jgi:hypothetical protein
MQKDYDPGEAEKLISEIRAQVNKDKRQLP